MGHLTGQGDCPSRWSEFRRPRGGGWGRPRRGRADKPARRCVESPARGQGGEPSGGWVGTQGRPGCSPPAPTWGDCGSRAVERLQGGRGCGRRLGRAKRAGVGQAPGPPTSGASLTPCLALPWAPGWQVQGAAPGSQSGVLRAPGSGPVHTCPLPGCPPRVRQPPLSVKAQNECPRHRGGGRGGGTIQTDGRRHSREGRKCIVNQSRGSGHGPRSPGGRSGGARTPGLTGRGRSSAEPQREGWAVPEGRDGQREAAALAEQRSRPGLPGSEPGRKPPPCSSSSSFGGFLWASTMRGWIVGAPGGGHTGQRPGCGGGSAGADGEQHTAGPLLPNKFTEKCSQPV